MKQKSAFFPFWSIDDHLPPLARRIHAEAGNGTTGFTPLIAKCIVYKPHHLETSKAGGLIGDSSHNIAPLLSADFEDAVAKRRPTVPTLVL